jgi:aminopeptidase N
VGSVQEHAVRLADAYLENEKLEPDLRSACLQSLPFTGERRYFDRMIAKYERVESVEEKLTLLRVMGQFDHEKILEEYLNYALGDQVRLQDLRTVFATITANPASKRCFFEWAKQSWSDLHELSESHFVYMGLLQALIVTARDKSTLRMVKAFLEANSEGFEQTRANAFEKAELGLAFQEREKFVFD